jgi:hypothetical protein
MHPRNPAKIVAHGKHTALGDNAKIAAVPFHLERHRLYSWGEAFFNLDIGDGVGTRAGTD